MLCYIMYGRYIAHIYIIIIIVVVIVVIVILFGGVLASHPELR